MLVSLICGVYRWVCIPTGEVYIGSSIDCEGRKRAHELQANRRDHNVTFQDRWDLFGGAYFKFDIIERTNSLEDARIREQKWICLLHPELNACQFVWGMDARVREAVSRAHITLAASDPNYIQRRKDLWKDPEKRRICGANLVLGPVSLRGKRQPIDQVLHRSASLKEAYSKESIRANHKTKCLEASRRPEVRANFLESCKHRKPHSAETREKMRQSALARWAPSITTTS
jgi:hypothetical protein